MAKAKIKTDEIVPATLAHLQSANPLLELYVPPKENRNLWGWSRGERSLWGCGLG